MKFTCAANTTRKGPLKQSGFRHRKFFTSRVAPEAARKIGLVKSRGICSAITCLDDIWISRPAKARMAELADAPDLGSGGAILWVRVPLRAGRASMTCIAEGFGIVSKKGSLPFLGDLL